ncbi:MAG: ATP-binding protein [Phycisphaerales bacterium]
MGHHASLSDHAPHLEAPTTDAESPDVLASAAYALSHDVRAPLLTIQGFSRELAEKGSLDPDGQFLLQRIIASAQAAQDRLGAVIAYSHIASRPLCLTRVNIRRLIEEELAGSASARGVGDARVTCDHLPEARADQALVTTLVHHLIDNAMRFRAPQRPLSISVSARECGALNVYRLGDNGIGFALGRSTRLFELFRRLHNQQECPGLGCGLAMARLIAARHGGHVWCDSEPGVGSSFYFSLPAAAQTFVEPKPSAPAGCEGRSLCVIVVEDSADDERLLTAELRRAGWVVSSRRVQTESDFRRELALGADVILADYTLPSFSVERALQVRAQMHSDVPLIVVTGTIGEETAVNCMKRGAADYLLKDRLARLSPAVEHAMRAADEARQRRRAELARDRAIRELDHRVLNNLAAIIGLVQVGAGTGGGLDQSTAITLVDRIRAMEIAHRELAARHWLGADLHSLLRRAALSGNADMARRLDLTCDQTVVGFRAAASIASTIHELATNAIRHGAWSNDAGRVRLSASREPGGIRMIWHEHAGPPVRTPPVPKLGVTLIREQIPHEASGAAEIRFEPGGVRAEFWIPIVESVPAGEQISCGDAWPDELWLR